jgi:hypothetical protein
MTATTAVQTVLDPALDPGAARLAEAFVGWLETGVRPDGLLAEDVFADLTVPHWRIQAVGPDATFHLREDSHPFRGAVTTRGLDRTSRGFLIEFEEHWAADGQRWYCRELVHGVVADGRVVELHIYCCGDWDEALQRRHTEQVHLVRP